MKNLMDDELRYREEGITGWLLWFTISVGLSILINGYIFVRDMVYILSNYDAVSVSPLLSELVVYEILIFSAAMLLIFTFVNICKRNIIFRTLYICAAILMFIAFAVLREIDSSTSTPNVANAIIWITYLFRSKRVKYVFAKTVRITSSGTAV